MEIRRGDRVTVHGLRGVVGGTPAVVTEIVAAEWLRVRCANGEYVSLHMRFVRAAEAAGEAPAQPSPQPEPTPCAGAAAPRRRP